MLSCGTRRVASSQAKRGFFDFLATTKAGAGGAAATRRKESFNWEWLEWFKENDTKAVYELDKIKAHCVRKDNQAREPSKPLPKIDWEAWKSKIKDPAFVENLRADYTAKVDIQNSFNDPLQHLTWSSEGKKEQIEKIRESMRESGVSPPDASDLAKAAKADIDNIYTDPMWVQKDTENEGLRQEMYLDYEQVEAERDLYGRRGEMAYLSENPQQAEQWEEDISGRQSYHDRLLFEWEYHQYGKRERLAQCQDEKQREIFLERYKESVKIHGVPGMEGF